MKKPNVRDEAIPEKVSISEQDAMDYLEFWQPVLGLGDWAITLRFPEKPHTGTVARVHYGIGNLTATMEIEPLQGVGDAEHLEATIVHELCHLMTRLWEETVADYVVAVESTKNDRNRILALLKTPREETVEQLAQGFVRLRYLLKPEEVVTDV